LVEHGDWSGAEPLFSKHGRLQAAHSRSRLLQTYSEQRHQQLREAPILVLDLVRCRRALTRPHAASSSTTRGTVVEVDDLLWDAAASLADQPAGSAVRDADGFHAQYLYVWGDRPEPLHPTQRTRCWDERVAWLLDKLRVVDRLERQHLAR
jgi:hypothetical protein